MPNLGVAVKTATWSLLRKVGTMSAMLCASIKILAWSFLRKVSGLRENIRDGGWHGFISLHVPGLQRPGRSLVQMPALGVAVKTATWSLLR